MVSQIITNSGMQLLASSTSVSGQMYWIGYYSLAYIPNFMKDSGNVGSITPPPNPSDADTAGSNSDIGPNLVLSTSIDKLNSMMTKLTLYGDQIWNIFQGDLVGPGFIDGLSGSNAGNLFGLTLYSSNVKKHYRYVLDENGNNNLLGYVVDPNNPALMLGAFRYYGTDGYLESSLPIPAPLYYFGDASEDNTLLIPPFSINDYLQNFALQSDTLFPGICPYQTINIPVASIPLQTALGNTKILIPKVSADFRGYLDYNGQSNNSPINNSLYFDTNDIPAANPNLNYVGAWFDSASTIHPTGVIPMTALSSGGMPYLNEFYKLISVSNYNRYHAPVGSDGNILNSDLANRNMAKVSKLFPIFDYNVINTQRGVTIDGQTREVATAISLTIDIDLAPLAKTQGYANVDPSTGVGQYNSATDLTLQNRYNNVANTDPLFNTTTTSFKFNRLGIWAVPIRKAPGTADPISQGKDVGYQVEIDPDAEPVLFAVVDWDNTISLSDSGDGAHSFRANINVNLESPDGVNETPLVRDTAIFYNLYNDTSNNWYRNQLLANASTQNAIIELQQELASLKQSIKGTNFTPILPPPPQTINTTVIKNQFNFSKVLIIDDSYTLSTNPYLPSYIDVTGIQQIRILGALSSAANVYVQFTGMVDNQPIFISNLAIGSAPTIFNVINGPSLPAAFLDDFNIVQRGNIFMVFDFGNNIWIFDEITPLTIGPRMTPTITGSSSGTPAVINPTGYGRLVINSTDSPAYITLTGSATQDGHFLNVINTSASTSINLTNVYGNSNNYIILDSYSSCIVVYDNVLGYWTAATGNY